MTLMAMLAVAKRRVLDTILAWAIWPRAAWCRKQRHLLSAPGARVVWVRGESVPWATWGAQRGYFEMRYMNGLAYLRMVGAPTV